MKKLLIALVVVAFGTSLSAQSTTDLSKAAKSATSEVTSEQDEQIKEALMKDKELQNATVDHLMSNKETKAAVEKLAKSAEGSKKSLMSSILGNKDLSAVAIKYIQDNPDLLKKAMKVVGM